MIPVFNGSRFLSSLLTVFRSMIDECPTALADVEIVVCNNVSTDETLAVARSFLKDLPCLRIVEHRIHKQTAEENIFRSFNDCRGYYTWALGVDDIPNVNSFPRVLELLRKRQHSFYVFNFATISEKMKATHYSNFYISGYSHETDLIKLTSRLGFWFTIAGISGQIVRTDRVKGYDLDGLVRSTSPIYAHVAAYLDCLSNESCLLVSESLVYYKITYRDVDHWKKGAELLAVFDEYFWTLGFVKQLKYLIAKRVLPRNYLSTLLDNNDHFFFRPISVIADKIVSQLKNMGGTSDPRNRFTRSEFEELASFVFDSDPFSRELIWSARDIFEALVLSQPVWPDQWTKLDILYAEYVANFLFVTMLTCTAGEYEIYDVHGKYWAVYRNAKDLVSGHLRHIDDPDSAPFIYIDADLDALKARLPPAAVAEAAQRRRTSEARAATVAGEVQAMREQLSRLGDALEALQVSGAAQREALASIGERLLDAREVTPFTKVATLPPVPSGVQADFANMLRGFRSFFSPLWYSEQLLMLGEGEAVSESGAWKHYERVGSRNGRNPNPWFSERWYLVRNPAAREMTLAGELVSGFHHYMREGFATGCDPGPRFCERAYLSANPDVVAAIAAGGSFRCGFEHWLLHGQAEGRGPLGEPRRTLQPA